MASFNMKITLYLFLFLTMTIITSNGNPSVAAVNDNGIHWNKKYYICGQKLIKAVLLICNSGIYKRVSNDFRLLIKEHNDTCCSYPCTLNSLKIFCDVPGYQDSGSTHLLTVQ